MPTMQSMTCLMPLFRELMTYMIKNSQNITPCLHLLFVARHLEHIGYHSSNVAETTYYTATARRVA